MKTVWKWEQGTRLEQGGHRVFRDARDDFKAPELRRWAIADNSGATPSDTDDGVLWLDLTRPLRVEIGYEKSEFGPITSRPHVAIPVVCQRDDSESFVRTSIMDGFAVLRGLFPSWHVVLSDGAETFLRALRVSALPTWDRDKRIVISALRDGAGVKNMEHDDEWIRTVIDRADGKEPKRPREPRERALARHLLREAAFDAWEANKGVRPTGVNAEACEPTDAAITAALSIFDLTT